MKTSIILTIIITNHHLIKLNTRKKQLLKMITKNLTTPTIIKKTKDLEDKIGARILLQPINLPNIIISNPHSLRTKS